MVAALLGSALVQVLVLLHQHNRGAQYFVPKKFLPQNYDYHRKIEGGTEDFECVICRSPIQHDNSSEERRGMSSTSSTSSTSSSASSSFSPSPSPPYMVTPCNHLFHPECLQQWMNVKLECPVCRRSIPPPSSPQNGTADSTLDTFWPV